MMDIIFENAINLFQSVVVTVFLMVSLGCKDKYNKPVHFLLYLSLHPRPAIRNAVTTTL